MKISSKKLFRVGVIKRLTVTSTSQKDFKKILKGAKSVTLTVWRHVSGVTCDETGWWLSDKTCGWRIITEKTGQWAGRESNWWLPHFLSKAEIEPLMTSHFLILEIATHFYNMGHKLALRYVWVHWFLLKVMDESFNSAVLKQWVPLPSITYVKAILLLKLHHN